MNLKKFGLVLFLIFSILPVQRIFAQTSNTGFVSGNIWYSKDPFEEGDKIQIYTFVFNPDSRELSGTVIFFDNTVLLGKKDFTIPAKGAEDVFIDWTVNAGDHNIFGKIENAKFLISKGKYEEIYLAANETQKSARTIAKKITSTQTNTNPISDIGNVITTSISNIKDTISGQTPEAVTKPIEKLRVDIIKTEENKKAQLENEIKVLDNTKVALNKNTATNTLTKPFKQVELFFVSIFLLILNNPIIFYGLVAIIVFFILRFIWKLVF